ncbi:hypothetical protein RRG08_019932 [Elysia crispata]|uniref:Uncharacterized protein n=1 Tax=Elysia crispata TaxID=231223 RepID=A0AAE0ZE35_9GAST|nr:hypothetical protein RRG08_019932 [Elysia crispata]
MKTSTKYWLSYTKTAAVDTSKATVYLLWPGKPDLRSDSYTFPEIRAKAKASRNADGTEHISKAFILAGLGALLAIAAGVALICYYEHGSRQTADRITFIVQSQAPAEGRGEKETETMAKRVEDGNATSSFGSVI